MCAVEWVFLAKDEVSIGDAVSADAGGMPVYRVMALAGGQAWLRNDESAHLMQAPLDRFPWKAALAAA